MRRRKRKKQKKIIILSTVFLSFIMITAYSAFSTNLTLTAKGNIKEKIITLDELRASAVTQNDGLYKSSYETDRYIYRGTNPNNYITFNNETAGWRILSIESNNTLKLIKKESIGELAFDEVNNRDSTTSTYCNTADTSGCSVWSATTNLVGTPSVFNTYYPTGNPQNYTENFSGTVIKDSSLNTYLNTTYLNSLTTKEQINVGTFNVGDVGYVDDEEDISLNIKQEEKYKWQGKVGLMTISEYMQASLDSNCVTYKKAYDAPCQNNWLNKEGSWEWTITPASKSAAQNEGADDIRPDGSITNSTPSFKHIVRPVIYTNENIKLSGKGTELDPYRLKN